MKHTTYVDKDNCVVGTVKDIYKFLDELPRNKVGDFIWYNDEMEEILFIVGEGKHLKFSLSGIAKIEQYIEEDVICDTHYYRIYLVNAKVHEITITSRRHS